MHNSFSPPSHLPCLRLSPHYLNSVQDSLEARIIRNVTTYSSAASLKYCHCFILRNNQFSCFGSQNALFCRGNPYRTFIPPICEIIRKKIILSHYMKQTPLRNLFNFEVPFSVGYDKDGRVSIESLFKCHQGFPPISRQQAHI